MTAPNLDEALGLAWILNFIRGLWNRRALKRAGRKRRA